MHKSQHSPRNYEYSYLLNLTLVAIIRNDFDVHPMAVFIGYVFMFVSDYMRQLFRKCTFMSMSWFGVLDTGNNAIALSAILVLHI